MRTTLGRRLSKLEAGRPRPSPLDAIDPILAVMSTPDLITLIRHDDAVRAGRQPSSEETAVYAGFRDRLASVGLVLP